LKNSNAKQVFQLLGKNFFLENIFWKHCFTNYIRIWRTT